MSRVSVVSRWALVPGHWSAWQAARVEVRQEHELQRREEHPVENRIVTKILRETEREAVSK